MTNNEGFEVPITPKVGPAKGLDQFARQVGQTLTGAIEDVMANMSSPEFHSKLNSSLTTLGRVVKGDTSQLTGDAKAQAENYKIISSGLDKMSETFKGLLTKSFDVLDTIYKELKKSSPLLQAVENLFNLAMQLFFMPLGNKLGELLIPAVIELVDNVVALWDEIGDGGLDEMFDKAVSKGVEFLSSFLNRIGGTLKEHGGILGAMGATLEALGSFTSNTLVTLITGLASLLTFVIENLKHIVSAIVAFKVASTALQLLTMYTIATSNSIAGWVGAGVAVAAGGTAFLASEALMSSGFGMAEGGYVPATEGGQVHLLGEGGEGEYVIPESKMGQMGGNTYNINMYSYDDAELTRKVESVIANQISTSRLRSGF